MVVYTSRAYNQAKTMKRDRKRLEQANITVVRVQYNRQLPPVN